jgi:hypothetical protein
MSLASSSRSSSGMVLHKRRFSLALYRHPVGYRQARMLLIQLCGGLPDINHGAGCYAVLLLHQNLPASAPSRNDECDAEVCLLINLFTTMDDLATVMVAPSTWHRHFLSHEGVRSTTTGRVISRMITSSKAFSIEIYTSCPAYRVSYSYRCNPAIPRLAGVAR